MPSAADDIFRKATKEQVIARCQDVIRTLRENKSGNLSKRFLYTPTVLSVAKGKSKFETPLKGPNNVDFKLTSRSFDESKLPLKKLSPLLSEIVTLLGFPAERLSESFVRPKAAKPSASAQLQNAHDIKMLTVKSKTAGPSGMSMLSRLASRLGPKVVEALPRDMKESVSTQTDENYCEKCIKLSLKLFKDGHTQTVRMENRSIGCQATSEDSLQSLAEMTPAQLRAINDFSKILRGSLLPNNYREATDLRDRLYNIYQTCTGINRNMFPRDIDDRMERDMRPDPGAFMGGGRSMITGGGAVGVGIGGGGGDGSTGRGGWRIEEPRGQQIPGSSLPYEPFTGVQDNRGSGPMDPRRNNQNPMVNPRFGNDNMGGGGVGMAGVGGMGAGVGGGGFQEAIPNGMMTSKQIMEMEQQRRNQQQQMQQQNNFNRMDPRFGGGNAGGGAGGGPFNQNFNNGGGYFNG